MAPMFCTKIFNWGKGKKEGGSALKNAKTLDTVYPEPQEEGELCPYWTHVQCQATQIGSTSYQTVHPRTTRSACSSPLPPMVPNHQEGFHHTATVKSPSAIRRGYHHTYRGTPDGAHFSPMHTPPFHSPIQSPIHHSQGRQSPLIIGHGRQSPLCQSRVPKSPSVNAQNSYCNSSKQSFINSCGNSPSHSSLIHAQQNHHRSGSQSSLHHSGSSQGSLHRIGTSVQSPLHHSGSSQSSLYRIGAQPQSPRHSCSAPQSPRHVGSQSPIHKGYIVEENYSQPLSPHKHPPPPPQRPPPPIPEEGTQLKGIPSASSSRSTSPANGTASFIPTPRSHSTRSNPINEKHNKSNSSSNGNRSSLRGPTSGTVNGAYLSSKQKDSMLDKFKIFNNKEKDNKSKNSGNNSGVSKRTSSSSGFSSARSERSDSSSTSLCSDVRPPPLPPHQNLPGSTTSSSSGEQTSGYPDHSSSGKSPGLRGIRSRFSRSSKEGKESPRSNRRSEERESSKGSPRSAHRAHRGGDSRDREREKGREKDAKGEIKVQEGRKSDKLTLNLDTGSRCMSTPAQVENSNRTSKLASISSSAKAAQQQRSPTMPQIPSPGSPLSSSGVGTGIPKPTAAVKGTTKPTPDKSSPSSPNVNTPSNTKEYHNKMARNSPAPPVRRTPIGGEAPPPPEVRDPKGSLPRQRNLGRREDINPVSVAMVSPMPVNNNNNINNNNNNNQVSASESGSALSEMSQNSGHSNSNSSGGSSVIYKPSSEDENSLEKSFKKEIGDKILKQEESEDVIIDVKPMQPLIRAAQYGYIRGLGSHNGRGLPPSLHVSRMALQDNSHTVPQKGMRMTPPHLRRHLVPGSPRSPSHVQGHIIEADYSDLECIDLANGYMSDGDVLRANIGCTTYPPPNMDGYLSEGGASLYAHRLNQRLKEGMRQVHESMTKAQHFMHDDSFDDSSSLSSGVSDTLNELSEDFLSTSLASEQTTAIAKARGLKEVGLKLPVGLSGPSPRKATMGMDPSGAYKVVSSKAHVKKTESSQQTEGTSFKQISNTQWKKYVDNGKANIDIRDYQRGLEMNGSNSSRRIEQKKTNFGTPIIPPTQAMIQSQVSMNTAASGSRKQDRKGVGCEKKDKVLTSSPQINGESKKIQNPKTAPSNFGYKKINGSSSGSCAGKAVASKSKESDPAANSNNSRDASSHSLDRPRTKLKVSGGTQTTSDLQYMPSTTGFHSDGEYSSNSLGRKYQQIKSYSLNGPAAAQLSQGVRERILQSPYRKVHMGPAEYAAYGQGFYRERSPRIKGTDGSLSDNPYSNYAEIQYGANPYGSPYSWVARNNYATSVASAPTRPIGGSLTEAESMESLSSSTSSFAAQLQHARATSLTQARLMIHQREMSTSPSPRLARSNSVSHLIERTFPRSTKSEKVLSMRDGYHSSQPTSPTPPSCGRLPMSPLNTSRGSAYYTSNVSRTSKDDECHGSSLSLVSSSSSLYSSQEDKHAHEVRKLRRDLNEAQDKVLTLTNQLTTNAHVVAAFEQSLTNMTNRLQHLTATSEQKECELSELRRTIDALRQQSIDAGLTVASFQSGNLVRGTSVESVSSLSSACSGTSHTSMHDKSDSSKLGKKKGWLRSSFTKAFSRGGKNKKHSGGSFSDADDSKLEMDGNSVPSSPLPIRGVTEGEEQQISEGSNETSEEVELLKRQLWEKDMVLTDIRLEALTSAHQLESLKETLNKMRSEMKCLKEDNDRLQRLMATESLASSRSSLPPPDVSTDLPTRPLSLTEEVIDIDDPTDVLLIDPLDRESKRGTVSVFIGCHGEYDKYMDPSEGSTVQECVIGAISISSKTKWDTLDSLVKRIFKEYLLRVDPSSNLGINSDSIVTYHLGEITRGRNSTATELLPCGYLVGEVTNVRIILKGAVINCIDALAFETLIPKSIVQRYISLLTEHRRIILCGASGTGKTYLAHKLAEFLVCRLGKDPSPGNIATFSVDHKTNKDLGAYLSHVSDQCENNVSELPLVIILDNLHYAGALTEVFNGFLSAKYTQCPFIIGTMIQATSCSTTNLQLHHNFRWVLMANHIEPVKGLLAKVSRRKLTQVEVDTCTRQPRLQQVLDWLPKCWAHINKFLETHSSSDVTIGPRLFLSCPSSVEGSQVWFTDLWNYSLVPYMVEAVREGLQLYGKRASWEDPSSWIQETYPWVHTAHGGSKALVSLRPEDVGYDSINASGGQQEKNNSENEGDSDPLLSMLMRLQEAANFSPQQDTATVSLENMENALESTL